MSADFVIEPAQLTDLEALLKIENDNFSVFDSRLSRRAFRYHLKSHNLLLVARCCATERHELAGYLLALLYRKSLRLYSLAVQSAYRQHGVASALLQQSLLAARVAQVSRLTLEVRVSNQAAQRLYAKQGFQPRKQIPGYYLDGTDALRMELLLNSDQL